MIKFVICDDNVPFLSKMKNILESIFLKYNYDAEISFCTDNSEDLVNFINNNHVDVLLLDICLHSDHSGIEIAKQIRKNNKSLYLIFITAHFEYIMSAYECKTFDYIIKPFSIKKLEEVIVRLFEDINYSSSDYIKLNHSNNLINYSSINFIQKDGMKTIYTMKDSTVKTYESFNQIIGTLPNNFVRCHKSYIVNLNNIVSVDFKKNLILFESSNYSQCSIGPKYKNNLKKEFNNYGKFF